VAAALAVHFVGAVATVTLGCILPALARGAAPPPPPRRRAVGAAVALPATAGGRSLAWRAAVALGLMAGFYGLAIAIALGLVWIPYAEFRYANRLHARLALFCLAGSFLILKSIIPKPDRFQPPGPRLFPPRHPRLFAELRRIAGAAAQEMPAEVYLVGDVNAWVSQRGGVMGFGSRRVMGLGLPLLQALRVSELRAVVAHEFGHYFGGDVKLGPWIYKTRAALVRTVQALAGHSGLLARPFLWYAALFFRATHAISRHQEVQADALAAGVAGGAALASGLKATHAAALAFQAYWAQEVVPVLGAGYLPPLAGGFSRFLREPKVAAGLQEAVEVEIREGQHDPYDTHPSLRDRLAAVRATARARGKGPEPETDPAAVSLLDGLPEIEKQLIASAADRDTVRRLKPVQWDDVGHAVYLPRWETFLREHGAALSKVTPATLPDLDWEALEKRLRASTRQEGDATGLAEFAVGAGLSVALSRQGFGIEAAPGMSVILVRGGQRLEPFAVRAALAGHEAAERWRALTGEIGIADLDLGQVAR
jgi:Zn-dependent protease with chaperone function